MRKTKRNKRLNENILNYVGIINKTRKFLTILLIFALIWTYIPWKQIQAEVVGDEVETVIIDNTNNDNANDNSFDQLTTDDESIAHYEIEKSNEVIDLRTGDSKTFRKIDGTYEVALYDQFVHHFVNNQYEEIDNSLIEGNLEMENISNIYKIKLPKKITKHKKFKYKIDDYEIDWTVNGIQESDATYDTTSKTKQNISDLVNLNSSVLYTNILNNVDLEYVLQGVNLKENIILNSYIENFELSFTYKTKNLNLIQNEQGNYSFMNDEGEAVVDFANLLMFDSNNGYSSNIEIIVTEIKNNEYQVTIKPDNTFLKNASYPVTVDPNLEYVASTNITFEDTYYFTTSNPTAPDDNITHYNEHTMKIGDYADGSGASGSNISTYVGLINMSIPSTLTGKQINYAYLVMNESSFYGNDFVKVYENTSTFEIYNFVGSTSTPPSYDPNPVDIGFKSGHYSQVMFDISKSIKSWVKDGLYNTPGFTLKKENSPSITEYYTEEKTTEALRPVIIIGYNDAKGLKDHWTYNSYDVSGAGSAMVSDYSGLLTVSRTDFSFDTAKQVLGSGMLYDINRATTNTYFGDGWTSIYDVSYSKNSTLDIYTVLGSSGNSTVYYALRTCDDYIDPEQGLDRTCYLSEDGNGTVMIREVNSTNITTHYLLTTSKQKFEFDSNNYLCKITDLKTDLFIEISRNHMYEGRIDSIRDSSGNSIAFQYSGKLHTAYLKTKQGDDTYYFLEKLVFTYSGDKLMKIQRYGAYTDNNNDGTKNGYDMELMNTIEYSYNSNQLLWQMRNLDLNECVEFTYNSDLSVSDVKSYHWTTNNQQLLGKLSYDYTNGFTTITDNDDNWTSFYFDNYGHTISTLDSEGHTKHAKYLHVLSSVDYVLDTSPNWNYNHKVISSSDVHSIEENLIKNPSFINKFQWRYSERDMFGNPYYPDFSINKTSGYSGSSHARISNANNVLDSYIEQTITLDKGTYTLGVNTYSNEVEDVSLEVICGSNTVATAGNVRQEENEWSLIYKSFNINSDNTNCSIQIHNIGDGTVRIDNVQLSKGYNKLGRNALENSSFEQEISGWSTTEGVTLSNIPSMFSNQSDLLGQKVLLFNNFDVSKQKASTGIEGINYDNIAGNTLTLGAFAGIINSSSTRNSIFDNEEDYQYFHMKVQFLDRIVSDLSSPDYPDYVLDENFMSFNSEVSGLQYMVGEFVVPEDTEYVVISFEYKGYGTVFFDHIQVFESQIFSNMDYDSFGQITTITDSTGEMTEYSYGTPALGSTPTSVTRRDSDGEIVYQSSSRLDDSYQVRALDLDRVRMNITRNSYGQVTQVKVGDDQNYTTSTTSYETLYSQYVSKQTDEFGRYTEDTYDYLTGLIEHSINSAGNNVDFFYNDNGEEVTIKHTDYCKFNNSLNQDECAEVTYLYTNGILNEIKLTDSFSYILGYDTYDRLSTVKIKNGSYENSLMSYVFSGIDSNGYLDSNVKEQHYANGNQIHFEYDDKDQVTSVRFKNSPSSPTITQFEYEYNHYGQVIEIKHYNQNGLYTASEDILYDSKGNISKIIDINDNIISYDYDIDQNLSEITVSVEGLTETVSYDYSSDKYVYQNIIQDRVGYEVTIYNSQILLGTLDETSIKQSDISFSINSNTYGMIGSYIPSRTGYYDLEIDYIERDTPTGVKIIQLDEDFQILDSTSIHTDIDTLQGLDEFTFNITSENTKYLAVLLYTYSSTDVNVVIDTVTLDYKGTQNVSLYDQTTFDNIAKDYIYENDPFYRLTQIQTSNNGTTFDKNYTYYGNTNRVTTIEYEFGTLKYKYDYTYDSAGNIIAVHKSSKDGLRNYQSISLEKYSYDELNQLLEESMYDYTGNCSTPSDTCYTKIYEYDLRGNIKEVKLYPYNQTEIELYVPTEYSYNTLSTQIYYVATGATELNVGDSLNLTFNYYLKDYQMPPNPVPAPMTTTCTAIDTSAEGFYLYECVAKDKLKIAFGLNFGILIKVGNPATTTEATPYERIVYNYSATEWLDQLESITTYDSDDNVINSNTNSSFTYDEQGNATIIRNFYYEGTYYNYAYLTYEGRQLTTIVLKDFSSQTNPKHTISYMYNEHGYRISKTVDGISTTYTLSGDKVVYETTGNNKIFYRFDYDGTLISMNYNESEYFYIHNLQGDIVQILDNNFNIVVEYIYDAWGNMTVKTDTSGISLSTINPYTYRGYRYDKETNLYYLNSRYYNPQVMRFVNADGLIAATGGILSHNMYAYTANNPVMYSDISGYFPDYLIDIPLFIIGLKDFIEDPSWSKAGWLALDLVLASLPVIPALSSARHLNKVDDGLDAIKAINAVDNFTDAGGIIRRANQADFTADAWRTINGLDNVNDFTKSSMSAGREIHKGFMNGGMVIDAANRVDGIDTYGKIIYELKPFNPRGVRQGIKQLYRYQNAVFNKTGDIYKIVLVLY